MNGIYPCATQPCATRERVDGFLRVPNLDPRTASSQSLAPSRLEQDQSTRRRLLLIYIHGFIGNEDSFHSFPYHVHVSLKEKVSATHVVHSKIYPRYKTYRAFHIARDNFSDWLGAHEDSNTDVILVGHSMGGILAAEVVLMVRTNKRLPLSSHSLTSVPDEEDTRQQGHSQA